MEALFYAVLGFVLNDPTFNHIVQGLSFIIVASKVVPALRFLGLLAQGILLVLQVTKWWMKTHPQGKAIAQDTNIDERIDRLVLKHDSELGGVG